MAIAREAAKLLVLVVVLVSVTHFDPVHGQPPSTAPAPAETAPDCLTVVVTNLATCLTFVEPGSNLSKPDKDCCPGLSTTLNSTPQCLCQLLAANASADFGVDINSTKAGTLPAACNLSTPPVSLCSFFGIPVASPVSSESPALAPGIQPETTAPPPERNGSSSTSKVISDAAYSVVILIGSLIILHPSIIIP